MPVNRNALIRYTTIDKCLRNKYRLWTLLDLQEACSEALYEFEGIDKGVSIRTIQLDIQNMRSEKLGYHAPIVVKDKKYYSYSDPDYSITKLPLTTTDLNKLNDAIEILEQFKNFDQFKEMSVLVNKLENKYQNQLEKRRSIIHMDKNENLKGIDLLNNIYHATKSKKVLEIKYKSFRARKSSRIILHPYILKEYNKRWYVVGSTKRSYHIVHLALDRIESFILRDDITFVDDGSFNPDTYYDHAIGVTIDKDIYPREIICRISHHMAQYILTKPIHHSQKEVNKDEKGVTISLKVHHNFELEKIILGHGPDIEVLSPPSLRKRIHLLSKKTFEQYE